MNAEGMVGKSFLFYNELSNIDPDVFCLVETWHIKTIKNTAFSAYRVYETYGTREGNIGRFKEGMILGIKKHIESELVLQNNYYCIMRITKFMVVFAYLSPAQGNDTIGQMFDDIKKYTKNNEAMIIVGDLNARIGTFENIFTESPEGCNRQSKDLNINKRGTLLIDRIIDLDLTVLNGTTASDSQGELTFVNQNGSSVIDICLVSRDIREKFYDFKVLKNLESSHFPILLSLSSIPISVQSEPKGETMIRILWDPNRSEHFKHILNEIVTENEPDKFEDIVKLIYETANLCGMVKTIDFKNKRREIIPTWYNKECRELNKNVNNKLRDLRRKKARNTSGIRQAEKDLVNSKIALKTKMKECREAFYHEVLIKLGNSKNPIEFYQAIALFRNKGNHQKPQCHVPITVFEAFFRNVFRIEEMYQVPLCTELTAITNINSEVELNKNTIFDIDRDFQPYELDEGIKELSKKKAPGSDGIPNEVWKALPDNGKYILLQNINLMFNSQCFPNQWSEIVICPIYKKGDSNEPSNYRPVSLANTILKLFTTMLSRRLQFWINRNNIISEYQAAYKKGTGCRDHVFVLSTAIQVNLARGRRVYALFVDMSQAFDTVNHEWLWNKLKVKGLSDKIINTIKAIYKMARAKIKTTYGISETFPIQKGVLQGETMSSILFNIYLEDLVEQLSNSDTIPIKAMKAIIHILLYADDIILLAYSIGELQKKINVLHAYCTRLGLRVNLNKTKYMIFSSRKDRSTELPIWGSIKIERVCSYVYLGVNLTEIPNFLSAKNLFFSKANIAAVNLHSLIYCSKMNNFSSQLVLYNSLVRSTLSYCSEVWGLAFSEHFEKFRIDFFKTRFLLPKMTPEWFVRLEIVAGNSELFLIKTVLRFWLRLIRKDRDSLIYKCYEAVKLAKSKSKKYNWYMQLKSLLSKWNLEQILDLENREKITFKECMIEMDLMLVKAESESVSNDIVQMKRSKFFNVYCNTKTHVIREEYLEDHSSWQVKQLIMQLKLGIPHLTYKGKVIRAKKQEFLYGKVSDEMCDLCGTDEEDVFHIMFKCPHYRNLRSKYISSQCNNQYDKTNYLKCFLALEYEDTINIYHYFCAALNRRKVYLDFIQSV